MTEQASAFFEENPGVSHVYQVGQDIFLAKHQHHAEAHANQWGLECKRIDSPDKPVEEDEDEFEKGLMGGQLDEDDDGEDGGEGDEPEEPEVPEEPEEPEVPEVLKDKILDVGAVINRDAKKLEIKKTKPGAKSTKAEKL